jgi:hypothetical protein
VITEESSVILANPIFSNHFVSLLYAAAVLSGLCNPQFRHPQALSPPQLLSGHILNFGTFSLQHPIIVYFERCIQYLQYFNLGVQQAKQDYKNEIIMPKTRSAARSPDIIIEAPRDYDRAAARSEAVFGSEKKTHPLDILSEAAFAPVVTVSNNSDNNISLYNNNISPIKNKELYNVSTAMSQKWLVILDIDETLGHCIDYNRAEFGYWYRIAEEENLLEIAGKLTWETRRVFLMKDNKHIFIRRPCWFQFVRKLVSMNFELVIWSAGNREYVQEVTWSILFSRQFIEHEGIKPIMVFCREHIYPKILKSLNVVALACKQSNTTYKYTTDQMLLIDNCRENASKYPDQLILVKDYTPTKTNEMKDDNVLLYETPNQCEALREELSLKNRMMTSQVKSSVATMYKRKFNSTIGNTNNNRKKKEEGRQH